MYIDGRRSETRAQAEAPRRGSVLRAGRLSRRRARAAVRRLAAHAEPPPQEAARGGHRRVRAPRPVGLLLRPPRRAEGAERMAELTGTDIRETVRERYAAAAGKGCGCQEVFGESLYGEAD